MTRREDSPEGTAPVPGVAGVIDMLQGADGSKVPAALGSTGPWTGTPDTLLTVPSSRSYLVCKRILDLSLAGLGLVVLLLPMAIVALVIRLTSPGPALFRQQRVGRRGRPFTMYKFRSMYVTEGDVVHRAAFQKFRAGMPLDATTAAPYKFHADPRITPIGRVLRRTSLDELPQLLNIVRGEMSLVGPRPPIPYELEMYEERHMRRLSVKPGLTGLWQVRGRSRVTFEEMVALDLEYIRTRSLVTDLKLLLATLPVILFQKGAG